MPTQIMPSIFEGRMTMRVAFANLCLEGKGVKSNGAMAQILPCILGSLAFPKHPPSQPPFLPTQLGLLEAGGW